MGEQTGISWSNATLNFWVGCTKVSNGEQGACEFCYAETWALRWPAYRETWGVGAARVRFKDTRAKVLKLERLAVASGAPFYCFSNSLSDIFDKEVPIEWLAEAFADMRAAPHVTFLLLTKRAPNVMKRAKEAGGLPPNAAIGFTAVTQKELQQAAPFMVRAKAELKPVFLFVSIEPMMESMSVWPWLHSAGIDWVITGGESGAHARPTHPDWFRGIRDQCAAKAVPYHHKQNGEWLAGHQYTAELAAVDSGDVFSLFDCLDWDGGEAVEADIFDPGEHAVYRVGKKRSGRLLDGVLHDAMPADAGSI